MTSFIERVRTRAYFMAIADAGVDAEANWLAAERIEQAATHKRSLKARQRRARIKPDEVR